MKDIQTFQNSALGKIRTTTNDEGEPLFCLADICQILNLRVDGVLPRLKKDGYNLIGVTDSLGRKQKNYFVNEMNLYKVIMRSDKPQAEAFQDWVCGEVLPSIRRYGAYMTESIIKKALTSPDFLIQLALNLKEERQKRIEAETKIAEDAPKITFTNAVVGSKSSCLVGELAKLLAQNGVKIGEKRLFEWLRENKYLCSNGERRNLPYQHYIDQGLFEIKRGVRSGNNGVLRTTSTTKVTGKGQLYFVSKFLSDNKK